jgi:ABC-type transporter Mla maintaining outer membrane lipid asymmetry permease subunit MlaE
LGKNSSKKRQITASQKFTCALRQALFAAGSVICDFCRRLTREPPDVTGGRKQGERILMETYIIIAVAAFGCGIVILLLRNTNALKRLALSSVGGLAAFGTVNLTGLLTGVSLVPNLWTICTAIFLGLPGVVCMMFLKLILKV